MANPVNTMNDNTPLVIQNLGGPPADETIASGQDLKAGSVLGVITSGGKLKLVDDTESDGSEDPVYVLLADVDASSADVDVDPKKLLGAGIVNGDKLIFGGDDDLADHYKGLKAAGIVAINTDNLEAYDNT